MKSNTAYQDVCIRDISSRGMLLQSSAAPPRGTYIEVLRGSSSVVARVVWESGQKFGVYTQEPLSVEALLSAPNSASLDYAASGAAMPAFDRRARPRPSTADLDRLAERSRWRARFLEFSIGAAACAGVALLAASAVHEAVSKPLDLVTAQLRQNRD